MAQITIYLDQNLAERIKTAARAANLSQSRWVANVLAEKLRDEWPASVVELAGAWSDFPDAATLREKIGQDVPREPLE